MDWVTYGSSRSMQPYYYSWPFCDEEGTDSNLRKVTIKSRKKGVAGSNKMDFNEA